MKMLGFGIFFIIFAAINIPITNYIYGYVERLQIFSSLLLVVVALASIGMGIWELKYEVDQ